MRPSGGIFARCTDTRPPGSSARICRDVACLAIAQHARRVDGAGAARRYDVRLPDRVAGRSEATLERDDEPLLAWTLDGNRIERCGFGLFDGRPLTGAGFWRALEPVDDADVIEAAWVLQRAVFVGTGRRHDFERMERATDFSEVLGTACHTFSPERVDSARKIPGTVRDWTDRPEEILDER